MGTKFTYKVETIIGLTALLAAILGFLLMILIGLPKANEVEQKAQVLREIPRDFFSSEITQQIRQLDVPQGVPVEVNPNNIGRTNVFERF